MKKTTIIGAAMLLLAIGMVTAQAPPERPIIIAGEVIIDGQPGDGALFEIKVTDDASGVDLYSGTGTVGSVTSGFIYDAEVPANSIGDEITLTVVATDTPGFSWTHAISGEEWENSAVVVPTVTLETSQTNPPSSQTNDGGSGGQTTGTDGSTGTETTGDDELLPLTDEPEAEDQPPAAETIGTKGEPEPMLADTEDTKPEATQDQPETEPGTDEGERTKGIGLPMTIAIVAVIIVIIVMLFVFKKRGVN
ncbi:MAG: hypothetical protein ABIC95_05905 [archaeon]